MIQCETQSKSYEETKELCETLEKEMISLMSPDLQAMFEDYKEYTLNLKQTEQRDAYIDGLAFGIRTISEAFLHENKNKKVHNSAHKPVKEIRFFIFLFF